MNEYTDYQNSVKNVTSIKVLVELLQVSEERQFVKHIDQALDIRIDELTAYIKYSENKDSLNKRIANLSRIKEAIKHVGSL